MKSFLDLVHRFAAPALSIIALTGLGQDIQSYSVPKEHPAIAPQPAFLERTTPPQAGAGSAPVRWSTPSTWKDMGPNGVRIGSFLVPGPGGTKADVAITSFPGAVGTELDNVNRWRMELGLAAIGEDQVSSEAITVDSLSGKQFDIAGASSRTVVVSLPRDGSTWFFKLRGDSPAVEQAKPVFLQFLQSVRFADKTAATAAQPDPKTAPATPQWAPPKNWTAKPHGPMVVESFSVNGDDAKNATVAISSFPGDVGGVFANVNRWRQQLGRAPIQQDELSSFTQAVDVAGGKGTVVDFTGIDPRSSKPARMVAVIVSQNENTWFYKLSGDDAVVTQEKPEFLKFVQTVRYP